MATGQVVERRYEVRRAWPLWTVWSYWGEDTDERGRHYELWKRVGIFFRRSSAESHRAWRAKG